MTAYLSGRATAICQLLLAALLALANPTVAAAGPTPAAAPPNWNINPADYQFNMSMVMRIRYNNTPSNIPDNLIGVFVGAELRGVAAATNIGGEMYYYMTVYSNQFTGETLRFRAYYAPEDQVYATLESVPFYHHNSSVGTFDQPFWININPNNDFAPELLPIPADTTLQNIPFDPVPLNNYLLSLDGDPVSWSVQPGPNLTATVLNGVLTVSPVSPLWTGTDSVTIRATEQTANQYIAERRALFTVLPDYGPPVFGPVPGQHIYAGDTFQLFDLDQYLTFAGPCRAFGLDVFPYAGSATNPGWVDPAPAGPSMKMVVRPVFANQQLGAPGARLAAFVNGILVGTASPAGSPPNVSYTIFLQNLASGPITFRLYDAARGFVYEKTPGPVFVAGGTTGTVAAPYILQLAPLQPLLAADGAVRVAILDPAWRDTFAVDFLVWDCNFPNQRRDTVRVLFSIRTDNRPVFQSPSLTAYFENTCGVLYDAQVLDPNNSEGAGLTYALIGGPDAGRFSLNPSSGILSWNNFSPQFANPADANGDNHYDILIEVRNQLNLRDTLALTVLVLPDPDGPFVPQLTGSQGNCLPGGSATLQASGGVAYLWSTGSTGTSVGVSVAGVYTVTVTDAGGCTAVLSTTLSLAPTIGASAPSGLQCAGALVALQSSPAGGTLPYTAFSWAGPNNFSAAVEDPAAFPAIAAAAGVYTVTVTDQAGCTATATTSLAVSTNLAPALQANAGTAVCAQQLVSLTAQPSGGSGIYVQFKWSGPAGFSSNIQNPAPFAAQMTAAGTYTATVTDNQGCTASATASLAVHPLPALSAGANSPLCAGANLQLNAQPTGGSGAYPNFTWTGPNNFAANSQNPTPFAAPVAASGLYRVTVSDARGCTATASTSVVVHPLPTTTAAATGPACTGGSLGLIANPAGGSGIYPGFQWAGPNNYSASGQQTSFFPANTAGGTYTVTVTDQVGCTATATTTITVYPVPMISASNNGPLCAGNALDLNSAVLGGSGVYNLYNWTGPDNYVAAVADPAPFASTVASGGVYRVTVTDSRGCTATATTQAAVQPKPAVQALGNGPICSGSPLVLSAQPSGGSGQYTGLAWSGPNNYTASGQFPAPFPASLASSGVYRVTVTDAGGCTATATVHVAVSNRPAPSVQIFTNSPVCNGGFMTLYAQASGGSGSFTAYQWAGPSQFSASGSNQNQQVTPAAGGTYTVTVTDSQGCTNSSSAPVEISVLTVTASGNSGSSCVTSGTVQLSCTVSGGTEPYVNFIWSGPDNYTGFGQNPPGFPASPAAAGVYTVTVTDSRGCTGVGTVSLTVGDVQPPSINCPAGHTVAANANCTAMLGDLRGLATGLSDNCTATGDILVGQSPAANIELSGLNATQLVTFTADDGNGNTATCSFTVSLADALPPMILCPADQTVAADASCMAAVGDLTGLASGLADNCTLATDIAVSQAPAANSTLSGHLSTQTITLIASDASGNTATCTFNLQIQDEQPPAIQCPPDQTVAADAACSAAVGDLRDLAFGLSDNCAAPGAISISQMPAAATVLQGHNDAELVTFTADDGNGNTASCSFTLQLKDISPPTIRCPADQTVAADANCQALVSDRRGLAFDLGDNCTAPGALALSQMPAATTVLQGHNDAELVTLTADDGNGNTASCSFTLTLKDITPPTISCPPNQTVAADEVCTALVGDRRGMAFNLGDNCTAPGALALSQIPAAATVLQGHNDAELVTLTADDGNGNTASCSFTLTLKDITPPTIICPPDQTVAANNFCYNTIGDRRSLASVSDNCTAAADIGISQNLPSSTYLFGHNSNRTIVLTADDGNGNTASCSFLITLKDITPPKITCPGALLRGCANNVPAPNPASASATDNCGVMQIVHQSDSAPYDQSCANRFKINRTYRATDVAGNTATCQQVITVNDVQTPVFNSVPANVTVPCNAIPAVGTPAAFDGCGGAVTIAYLGQTQTSGACADAYTLTRTWRATDACGNSVTASQRITVQDTQKPVIVSTPPNVTISCTSPLPAVGLPTASDNCDNQVDIVYLGEWNMNSTCPGTYQLLRYWQATDNCGNWALASQTITVQDNQPPVFTSVPPAVTIDCQLALPPIGTATASDGCSNFTQVTFLGQTRTDGSCLYNYTITRVWRATDLCGNAATASQVITVRDNQAPVFNNPPLPVTVACNQIPAAPNLSATDLCGSATVTYLGQTTTPGDCASGYTITRRWQAVDLCGNQRTHTQLITVMPNQYAPPVSERSGRPKTPTREFYLAPNPAFDQVSVDLRDYTGEQVWVAVYSPLGALLWEYRVTEAGEDALSIDLHRFDAGLYLVAVRGANGQTQMRQLICGRR